MSRDSSSLGAFAADELIQGDGIITSGEMYNAYEMYCQKHNLYRETKRRFDLNLTKFCNFLIHDRTSKKKVWKNVFVRGKNDNNIGAVKIGGEKLEF
jgi:hypothetical protein